MRLPDLDDMLKAGMTLSEALAFWNRMMGRQDIPAKEWWKQLRGMGALQ